MVHVLFKQNVQKSLKIIKIQNAIETLIGAELSSSVDARFDH